MQIDQIVRFIHCGEHFYEIRADWKRSEKHQLNYMVELQHSGHRELNHLANMTISSQNGGKQDKNDKDFDNWKALCEKKASPATPFHFLKFSKFLFFKFPKPSHFQNEQPPTDEFITAKKEEIAWLRAELQLDQLSEEKPTSKPAPTAEKDNGTTPTEANAPDLAAQGAPLAPAATTKEDSKPNAGEKDSARKRKRANKKQAKKQTTTQVPPQKLSKVQQLPKASSQQQQKQWRARTGGPQQASSRSGSGNSHHHPLRAPNFHQHSHQQHHQRGMHANSGPPQRLFTAPPTQRVNPLVFQQQPIPAAPFAASTPAFYHHVSSRNEPPQAPWAQFQGQQLQPASSTPSFHYAPDGYQHPQHQQQYLHGQQIGGSPAQGAPYTQPGAFSGQLQHYNTHPGGAQQGGYGRGDGHGADYWDHYRR